MSLQAMVNIEARTLSKLRSVIADASDRADRPKRNLNRVSVDLQKDIEAVLLEAREEAARAAYEEALSLADELDEDEPDETEADPESELSAVAAALSLAGIWMMMVLTGLGTSLDYRLRTTAATEVARAYNEAMLQILSRMNAKTVLKRWDATLDRITCAVCRAHDGETVAIDKDFSNHDVPSFVHPNCRCVITFINAS